MSSDHTRDGITLRSGRVTPDHPVLAHVHPNGHWLICTGAEGSGMMLTSDKIGRRRMVGDEAMFIEADDIHSLTVESGWASYKCCGRAPL